MAWVHRTTRDHGPGSFQVSTAATHLGPGQYETSPSRRLRPNAAPFGSSAQVERGAGATSPGTIGQTFVTPGPGTYGGDGSGHDQWDAPLKQQQPQSSVFQSKTQREIGGSKTGGNQETPGPGAYSKQDSFGRKAKKKPGYTPLANPLSADPPKSNRIKWARLPTAPSIPTHAQSFGYEQGPYGKLVRHEPGNVGHSGRGDDTLGPGEYDPLKGLKSIHKPRAVDFSRSKVTRSLEREIKNRAEMPGPGQYEDPNAASVPKGPQRTSAVFKSVLTRDKALLNGDSKSPVPGPGSYFEGYKGFTTASKPEHLQFFGSTSTRFDDTAQRELSELGPGAYYAPPVNFSAKPAVRRKGKSAPFSSKKERFDMAQPKEEYIAAPGSYNLPTAMSEVINKVSSRVQTFGSTTKRFDSMTTHGAGPETAESQLEREMKAMDGAGSPEPTARRHKQPPKMSSVFASSSNRFQPLEKTLAPSPGDYQITSSWNAPGATGIFKSSTDRMKGAKTSAAAVPGPGHYSAPASVNQKPLHMARPDVFVGAEPRFKKTLPKVAVPGPGQYSTQTIESDWNRPTYNITIATEMELAMLR